MIYMNMKTRIIIFVITAMILPAVIISGCAKTPPGSPVEYIIIQGERYSTSLTELELSDPPYSTGMSMEEIQNRFYCRTRILSRLNI